MKSEAWAWEAWQMHLAIQHALRKLRDVPHESRSHTIMGITGQYASSKANGGKDTTDGELLGLP